MTDSQRQHNARNRYRHGELEVIDCLDCGYKHLWPLPTPKEVQKTYQRRFGGAVRSGFEKRKREDADYWERVFERRLASLTRLLGGVNTGRVLDLGCGVGDYLGFMGRHGWETWGIEPSEVFREALSQRGIHTVPSMVEQISERQWEELGQFDVVNMSQFLEHVLDPVGVLEAASRAVRPGGLLAIECPNDFNPLQRAAVESQGLPRWWISPLHINYFDFESLERLCENAGFKPVDRSTQFPIEMFLHFGELYVGNDELGRAVHRKRVAFEESLVRAGEGQALTDMYSALAQAGLGRHATIYAVKV